jgi:hypothetical protein
MRLTSTRAALAAAVVSVTSFAFTSAAQAVTVFATTPTNQLISFDSATPGTLTSGLAITGLAAGEFVKGIDFRPATNELYALGSFGNIYTLNTTTAAATFKSAISGAVLNGAEFGIDFNPVPDRLRVVSNSGQNLRINVDTGVAIVDGAINPVGTGLFAAGYINNFAGAGTTTLYTIDGSADVLNTQNPPNNGTQALVGSLGLNVSAYGDLDIITPAVGSDVAYAALNPAGSLISNFYTINLSTGAATLVGQIDGGILVNGIAVVIPEPASLSLLGLAAAALVRRRRA